MEPPNRRPQPSPEKSEDADAYDTQEMDELQRKLAEHELTEAECYRYLHILRVHENKPHVDDFYKLIATLTVGAINNRLLELTRERQDDRPDSPSPPTFADVWRRFKAWWSHWWSLS